MSNKPIFSGDATPEKPSGAFGSITPFFGSDMSSLQITTHRLNVRNYLQCSQSVKIVICARGKLGFLTDDLPTATTDPTYSTWLADNSIVLAWIINSMEPNITRRYLWFKTSNEVEVGYSRGQNDNSLFVKHSSHGHLTVLIVYVDDIVVTGDDCRKLHDLKLLLAKEFEVKVLGLLRYFLGMEVAQTHMGILVSQRKYTLDLLAEAGMLGCKPCKTPLELENKWSMFEGAHVDVGKYQCLVGKLIYLSHTRPDIAVAVEPGQSIYAFSLSRPS
ncbi:Cysteine-rich RLK (receptor-like protein kinase) 8 [Dorcoceras hygrometricum]|uniref:Cysteine-rich RLK (Receptor-like protein kinase) 8 n=1 Tax=Dorcoceras hygrometricum TaxID=472368 RepID=A0A2Z7BJE9_9LAMI|nr:Cysteine-rich RLK (receptor-like protein kinase) 8 [Dorcoceras hygrometricum]